MRDDKKLYAEVLKVFKIVFENIQKSKLFVDGRKMSALPAFVANLSSSWNPKSILVPRLDSFGQIEKGHGILGHAWRNIYGRWTLILLYSFPPLLKCLSVRLILPFPANKT